jgi:cellulose synthase/poly-beta-1,6-N-acetylglucosamine synthase-like glycosyltransferase
MPARRPEVLAWIALGGAVWGALLLYSIRTHDIVWLQVILLAYALYGITMHALGVLARFRRPPAPPLQCLPFVTVLIPARNEAAVIARSVRSACSLRYHDPDGTPRFEVIVLDDASTDGTAEVVRRMTDELPVAPQVVRIPDGAGGSKAAVLNAGLRKARGELVAVFDADARVHPAFLLRAVPYLLEPGVAGVQGLRLFYHPARTPVALGQDVEFRVFQALMQRARERFGACVIFGGNGVVVNRLALVRVGGWNPQALTEDIDLAIRFHALGWRVRYCEEAVVWEESVPTWWGLVRQRTRWSEGALGALSTHLRAILTGRATPFQKLDLVFFLTGSVVIPAAIFTSYLYGAATLLRNLLEPLYLLPLGRSLPPAVTDGAFLLLTASLGISIGSRIGWHPLRIAGAMAAYLFMGSHQVLSAPLAVLRYARSALTGRVEWLRTPHGKAPRVRAQLL